MADSSVTLYPGDVLTVNVSAGQAPDPGTEVATVDVPPVDPAADPATVAPVDPAPVDPAAAPVEGTAPASAGVTGSTDIASVG